MEYDGSIKFSIDADDKNAKKTLDELKKELENEDLSERDVLQFEKLSKDAEKYSRQIQSIRQEIDEFNTALEDRKSLESDLVKYQSESEAIQQAVADTEKQLADGLITMEQKKELIAEYNKEFENVSETISIIKQELEQMNSAFQIEGELNKAETKLINIEKSILNVQDSALKMGERLGVSSKNTEEMAKNTGKLSYSMDKASAGAKSMGDSIGSGVKKVTRYALALFGIRSVYTMLSRLSREWLNSNDVAAKQMQSNVQALSNGLSQLLAPVLQTIVGWITTLMGYVNALTKAFFGVELFTAKTNKNLGKATGNAKKLGKEVKKFTASFDEADVASENIADNLDSGAGGAGGMDLPQPSIPTPDISGIMSALSKVKEYWHSIWDSEVMQAFMNLISAIIVNSMQSAISIAGNLWGNLVELWYAVLPNLTRGFQAMLEYWTNVFNDMAEVINTWSPVITASINGMVDRLFNTFTPFFVWLAGAWADIGEGMVDIWNKHGKAILSGVGEFINNLILLAQSIWDNIIHPILEPAIEHIAWIWDSYLKDILLLTIDIVGQLIRLALDIVNKFIMPIVSHFMQVFKPSIELVMGILSTVSKVAFGVLGTVAKATLGMVQGLLDNLIKFVNSDFAKGFVNGFKWAIDRVANLFDSLVWLIKSPLNAIIGMINGMIRGLNKISLPSWVPGIGGKGINIGTIPYLAKGGVLNRPTLNVAGEAGKEAVVPLENNTGWAKDFLGVLDQYGGLGGNSQPTVVQIQLDRRTIAEAVIDELDEQKLTNNRGGLAWNM